MGACLAANNARGQHSENILPSADNCNLRNEIAQQLQQNTLAANIPREELSFHNSQPSIKVKSSSKVDNLSEPSDQFSDGSRWTLHRSKRSEQNMKMSLKKVNQVSLKDVAEVNIINPIQSQRSMSHSIRSQTKSDCSDEVQDDTVQTPHSRKRTYMAEDMNDRGLADDDNKLIACTMACNTLMRLGEIKLNNMSVYNGEWLKGKRNGQGVLKWQDGSIYVGKWLNDCSQGQGKLTYSNGGLYQGEFEENKAHGKGVFNYPDGSRYEGDWRDDEPEGVGILNWDDDERYEGEWLAGKKHGYGQIFFKDDSFYKGQFHSNEIHGKGYYNWHNSKDYEGEWEHNQMSGKGKLAWMKGDIYQGYFVNGKFQGLGVMRYTDSSTAEGSWQKGRKHGFFIETDPSGKKSQIEWHMGKRAKPLIEYSRRQARRLKDEESKTTSSQ